MSYRRLRNPAFNSNNLLLAFKEIRKSSKLIVRQNFWCCSGCAAAALSILIGKKPAEKAKKIRGVLFFHRQDDTAYRKGYDLHLRYGPVNTSEHGLVGIPAEEIGREIIAVLDKHKVPYEWNGNSNETIKIIVSLPIAA